MSLLKLLFIMVMVFSCSLTICMGQLGIINNFSLNNKTVIYNDFDIQILEFGDLPYNYKDVRSLSVPEYSDKDGIYLFNFKGKNYYHPVHLSQRTFILLNNFYHTNNTNYIKTARLYAEKLLEISTDIDGALFFPYQFDYALHGIESETLKSPWYSAMAQGQALSVFCRLYELTGENKYLNVAKKTFNSFMHLKDENNVWVTRVDEEGYLWLEEYPMDIPTSALNGFIFALFGIYDYYRINPDSDIAMEFILASLTTIYNYSDNYRNIGDISYYCLKHKDKIESYHDLHSTLYELLYKISEEKAFQYFADLLRYDCCKNGKELQNTPQVISELVVKDFKIVVNNFENMPFYEKDYVSTDRPKYHDNKGIHLYLYKNEQYYNPEYIAKVALRYLSSYEITENPRYLEKAKIYGEKLLELSEEYYEAIFFPFSYDFSIHGDPKEVITAPWYSCVAQGNILSFFVRLYEKSNNTRYLTYANKVYKSLTFTKENYTKWIAWKDQENYIWFENFPDDNIPERSLTGHVNVIFGIYDYYRINQSDLDVKKLLNAAITTVYHYLPEFRNENDTCYFCLKHKAKSIGYHNILISQLIVLSSITGDEYFMKMATLLKDDINLRKN